MFYTSTVESDDEALQAILNLHCENTVIDIDVTYSKGNFYKKNIMPPKYKFDLYPQTPDTVQANAEAIPLEDGIASTIMFDPPFLATTGPSLKMENDSNKINKRFGVFSDEKSLHTFYVNAMKEQYRLLKENGILIFKCQDKVSSGKQYLSHVFIINEAIKIGFYPKDFFILLAKNRIVANWQKNQKHCRKYHSYYIVFEKCNKVIDYV